MSKTYDLDTPEPNYATNNHVTAVKSFELFLIFVYTPSDQPNSNHSSY